MRQMNAVHVDTSRKRLLTAAPQDHTAGATYLACWTAYSRLRLGGRSSCQWGVGHHAFYPDGVGRLLGHSLSADKLARCMH